MSNTQRIKQKLVDLKASFQQAYLTSACKESFHDWIQENTWGLHMTTTDFTRYGVDEDDALRRVQQREKNNQTVRQIFFDSLAKKAPFSIDFMCDIHAALFDHVLYGCGYYRTEPAHMYDVQIKIPHPYDIPQRMNQMQQIYRHNQKKIFLIF